MSDVTTILENINSGKDPHAAEKLLNVVYDELRIIARAKMAGEKPGHTLQPTLLVDDAWRKLFPEGKAAKFDNRAHFFSAAGEAIRRILVDHARRKNALKRGKRVEMSTTQLDQIVHPAPDELKLAVNEALEHFSKVDPHTVKLINLRFWVHMTMKEAAQALNIPLRSAERDYAYFTAWFRREFGKEMNI